MYDYVSPLNDAAERPAQDPFEHLEHDFGKMQVSNALTSSEKVRGPDTECLMEKFALLKM